jgi:hypothetical protein
MPSARRVLIADARFAPEFSPNQHNDILIQAALDQVGYESVDRMIQ